MKDHFSWHRNEQHFSKHHGPLISFEPFVARDDVWKRSRGIFTPITTSFRVESIFPLIDDSCNRLSNYLKGISPKEHVEAKALATRFTTQNVMMCSFGLDSNSFEENISEVNLLGNEIFKPTNFGGIKLMLMNACPFLIDTIPLP